MTNYSCDPKAAHWASILIVLSLLAGCGGGGGGGGGAVAPNPGFTYPTSLMAATGATIGGSSVAYSLNTDTDILTATPLGAPSDLVTLNSPSAGAYTVTVNAISHPGGTSESAFTFVAAPGSLTSGNVQGTSCANCFRTGNLAASDGQTVAFIDLDLAAAGMTYSTLGLWTKPSLATPSTREVGGGISFGVLTRGVDLPTTGSATYNGIMVGRFADGTETLTVGATATATANFGTTAVGPVAQRSVAFSTSGTTTTTALGATAAAPLLNLSGSFAYTPGTNALNSTSFTTAGGMNGDARAAFYGPPGTTAPFAPAEFGGTYRVTNGADESMVGSFALKR